MSGQTETLLNICRLAQSITNADRVAVSCHLEDGRINTLARSTGPAAMFDKKYRFPLLSLQRPTLHIPDVSKVKDFVGHPVFELTPNMKSLIGHYFKDVLGREYSFIVTNPDTSVFENLPILRAVEGMIEVILSVLRGEERQETSQFSESAGNQVSYSPPVESEPTLAFLRNTLLTKQRLLSRNGVSYIALRQWRKDIKPHQIAALTSLKKSSGASLAAVIAAEFEEVTRRVFGSSFESIVPIPGGSSGREDSLSVQTATLLAKRLDARFSNVLVGSSVKPGSSHPSKSAALRPYGLKGEIEGSALVVDDVATSGRHIELAAKALSAHCSHCMGLVWIAD